MENLPHVERLTPLDLLMPRTYIKVLLTFRTTENASVKQNLQDGLDGLSKAIPWLSGRIFPTAGTLGEPPSLEIRWRPDDPTPVLVEKGMLDLHYEELSAERMPTKAIPTEVWPVPNIINDELFVTGAPVFGASYFRFADNQGVGVCVCVHHNAVDATGFADIIRLWVHQVTESTMLYEPQNINRAARLSEALLSDLEAVSAQASVAILKSHPEYSNQPPVFPTEFHPCMYKMFAIPLTRVNDLKEDLGRHMTPGPTTNTVACALIWSAILRARSKRNPALLQETSRLAMAVNGRRRLSAGFISPATPYLANLVLYSLTQLSIEDLIAPGSGAPMSSCARICDSITQSQSQEQINARHIAEVYSLVDRVDDYRTVFVGWDLFNSRDLTITSWADLDLYEMTFGKELGKPDFVRIPGSEADGVGIILPRKRKSTATGPHDEVLEVIVMLREDDMSALEQDSVWKNLIV